MSRILATFRIPGEPVACPRPRVTKQGRPFYPPRYEAWKRSACLVLRSLWRKSPMDGHLAVRVTAVFPRPKSRPPYIDKADWQTGHRLRRNRTPDADNVAKAVLDACTSAAVWVDDARVWRCDTWLYTAAKGERPGVTVEVWQTDGVEVPDAA